MASYYEKWLCAALSEGSSSMLSLQSTSNVTVELVALSRVAE